MRDTKGHRRDMMKSAKVIAVALMGAFLLEPTGVVNAQDVQHDTLEFRLKSPQKAQAISALSTIGPVATGVLWWALDSPEEIQSYSPNGRLRGSYPENADRTGPVTLILSGIMVGPSVGYFYGDCPDRGAKGIMLRVGIGALTMIAADNAASRGSGDAFSFDGMAAGLAVAAVGVGVITIYALYDIGRVQSTVEDRNGKMMRQHEQTSVKLLPRYFADSGAAGFGLNISF
jgi:hypothetical protein